MDQVLDRYCLQEGAKGLLLLSMPTGSGKTHSVLDFIYKHYPAFAAQGRRIIFVTSHKKNLPWNELRSRFQDDGKPAEYDRHVLFINSNADGLIDQLPGVDPQIPDIFKNEGYILLKSYVDTLSSDSRLPNSVRNSLKDAIRKDLEPRFRKSISEHLQREFKSKKDRVAVIRSSSDYRWIGKLYPAVFTDEKTVLFLSVDKLIRKNTTLVEKSYYFTERLAKDAVIFIDEFDATKENILTAIIESGLKHRVSILDLFLNIHNHLVQSECPAGLLRESNRRKEQMAERGWIHLTDVVGNFLQKAEAIYSKYNLHHTCKSHEEFSTNKRNFLFYDYQFHHVLDARNKRIEVVKDAANRANWIKAVQTETTGQGINIRSLLSEIAGFLTYFQRGIRYLAENYCELKQEEDALADAFPLESAVRTVLNHFRLDTDDLELLTGNIMEGNYPYGLRSEARELHRQGFYDTGFRYHDIVDSDEHDTLSKIYMFNFQRTPEAFLAGLCSQSMVVGISATAALHTNIGNYDLEYLRSRLDRKFYRISEQDLERLKERFDTATKGYDRIDIRTQFIGAGVADNPVDQLTMLLDDREAAEALRTKVAHANPEADDAERTHILARYARALLAWNHFLENPQLHGFLCLFSKLPKARDSRFDLDIFKEYARMLLDDRKSGLDEDADALVAVLTSENFEENKARVLRDLSKGNRRFIVSAYQTIGAGQNLQFAIPASADPVQINDFPARGEMDVSGIYLDHPTNLLVNIYGDHLQPTEFIKYLFQLEFLLENGAISPKTFKAKLDEAFHRYVGRKKYRKAADDFTSLYQTEAFTRFVNKVVVQAIGRICRTNMKASSIHILADSSLRKHLTQFAVPNEVIPVREYTSLRGAAGEAQKPSSDLVEFENRASARSNRTVAFIQRQLRTPWTKESVCLWQNLRARTLAHPVVEDKSKCDPVWNTIYVELPAPNRFYRYTQERDYRNIDVHFSSDKGEQEVSATTARLPELMAIQPFRRHFEEQKWMTDFPAASLMLTPPMFNNIYKGALGEAVGRFVLSEVLGIELEELEVQEFEYFDFKSERGAYVDFKLWSDSRSVSAEDVLLGVREKMDKCGADRVFIINILASPETRFHPIESKDRRIVEVPFLCQNSSIHDPALTFIRKEFSK